MKKGLKIGLIIGGFLIILGGTFMGLTKRFKSESLGTPHCGVDKKYDWKDKKCYQKCKNGCSYENCRVVGWNCHNECVVMCEIPKYENCISECKYETCKSRCGERPQIMLLN